MSTPGLLVALALAIVVGYLVLRPVFFSKEAKEDLAAPTPLAELEAQREAVLAAIRELDFDYHTGKVTEADYAERREALVQQGVALLKEIDRLTSAAGAAPKEQVAEKT